MSLRDIIVHSSNIGTVLITEGLGTLKFGHYLHEFGFGSTTGLGLPDESAGIMKPAADWQATEKVTPRYGYGYAATSLQLVAAVNTIANGGVYVAPRLVLSTIDANGQTHNAPPSPSHEVVTPQTAATMTSMMKDVVCYGTAKYAKVPGMSVAGKTGTALLKPDVRSSTGRRAAGTGDRHAQRRSTPTGETNPRGDERLSGRRRDEGVLLDLRRLLPGRQPTGHDPRLDRPAGPQQPGSPRRQRLPGRCSRRWRPSPCTSFRSAPHRTTTAARTAQDDSDGSHASRGGRAARASARSSVHRRRRRRSHRSTSTRARCATAHCSAASGERSPTVTSLPPARVAAGRSSAARRSSTRHRSAADRRAGHALGDGVAGGELLRPPQPCA